MMSCSTVGKCVIVPLNSFSMVIGLVFTVAGIILTFFPDLLLERIYPLVKESLDKYLQTGVIKLPENVDDLKELPFVTELGVSLLALGVFMFVVSCFGWSGATCTSCCRWMLLVFTALLLVIMLAEIVTGSLFLVSDSTLHKNLRSKLKEKISAEFSENSTDAFSSVIIIMSNTFDCCGIDGVADFGVKGHHFCEYDQGCYPKLTGVIEDNVMWAGLILAGILSLQLLEAVLAILIFKTSNKISPA